MNNKQVLDLIEQISYRVLKSTKKGIYFPTLTIKVHILKILQDVVNTQREPLKSGRIHHFCEKKVEKYRI